MIRHVIRASRLLWLTLLMCIITATTYAESVRYNAIVSPHPLATQAGVTILEQGGNAFDAAIAVAAALAVVEPYNSGLGGGGFWLLHDAQQQQNIFIDAREVAPTALHEGSSLAGVLAAGIPGTPAALAYLAENYGLLPLSVSLQPAIQLAKMGFPVDKIYRELLQRNDRFTLLQQYPSSAAIFLTDAQIPELGTTIIQTDLANTLTQLAEQGHVGFYAGEVAELLVQGITQYGGVWTQRDLADYSLKLREPLIGTYQDMTIITAPPPSAGGLIILTSLNILAQLPPAANPAESIHQLAEAMRLSYWDRSRYLADPDFQAVPVKALLSQEHVTELVNYIQPNQATKNSDLETKESDDLSQAVEGNTTHFSILDAAGNQVAATLSLNDMFGSGFVAPGTGVLMNNELGDFDTYPNHIEPGKRPLSSMSPTFVFAEDKVAILGTPGHRRIPTMVLLAILDFAEGNNPESWVSKPRFHHQYLPDTLKIEPGALDPATEQALSAMGYTIQELEHPYGNMQAILWDKTTNQILVASDPRGIGEGAVIAVDR